MTSVSEKSQEALFNQFQEVYFRFPYQSILSLEEGEEACSAIAYSPEKGIRKVVLDSPRDLYELVALFFRNHKDRSCIVTDRSLKGAFTNDAALYRVMKQETTKNRLLVHKITDLFDRFQDYPSLIEAMHNSIIEMPRAVKRPLPQVKERPEIVQFAGRPFSYSP